MFRFFDVMIQGRKTLCKSGSRRGVDGLIRACRHVHMLATWRTPFRDDLAHKPDSTQSRARRRKKAVLSTYRPVPVAINSMESFQQETA